MFDLDCDRKNMTLQLKNKKSSMSFKCIQMLQYFGDNKEHSRAEVALDLELTLGQVTGTMEQLKQKGYVFDTAPISNGRSRFFKYKLSDKRLQPNEFAMTLRAVNERFVVELNKIRLLANDHGDWEIERIASEALMAGGLHTD